ncbi:unnamed protein product [Cuscuta epithymum]|uniref:Uncharacterized protein n=1 Tax=Cuscuta epithymum TaxID=186058 RepID=A0AAV0DF15_9ASTE|nr:unnamed protein product [Cuscuta epithymum]
MNNSNATWYMAVPTTQQIILDRHFSNPEPVYPRLRFIRSCSAALAPSILIQQEEAFGAPFLEVYAMIEVTLLIAWNTFPGNRPHVAGSIRKPVGQEMAVLGENGIVQDAGSTGDTCFGGSNVTKGYKNYPDANKSASEFRWLQTGDLGYTGSEGYLHLVSRIKEINRGGGKISPIEVDACLVSHPEIAQAVAFRVPDDKYGEEINCAIIANEGATIDEEVLKFCKRYFVAFKVPKKVLLTDAPLKLSHVKSLGDLLHNTSLHKSLLLSFLG